MKTSQITACKRIRKLGIYPQNIHHRATPYLRLILPVISLFQSLLPLLHPTGKSAQKLCRARETVLLGNSSINRHATSCLDDGFKGSRSNLSSGTGGNEKYVVRLQIDVRRFCGQN